MIELWELSLHLFPLEEVILGLLTHWRDEVELPGYRVRLLHHWGGPMKKHKIGREVKYEARRTSKHYFHSTWIQSPDFPLLTK